MEIRHKNTILLTVVNLNSQHGPDGARIESPVPSRQLPEFKLVLHGDHVRTRRKMLGFRSKFILFAP